MIHHFNDEVAKKLGVGAAIILYNLAYIQANREAQGDDRYFHAGRWWVRHSYESLAEWHGYFSVPQIKRIMKGLLDENHVVKRHLPGFDRTLYWSVTLNIPHDTKSYDRRNESVPSDSTKSSDVLHDNNNKTNSRIFEVFWSLYPKKTDKKNARIKFLKLSPEEQEEAIKFLDQKPFKDTEVRFVPHPTTFINGARWEDELPATRGFIGI